jgi:hypothetical protein
LIRSRNIVRASVIALSGLCAACGSGEGKGGLPDGVYQCTMGTALMGNITIDGGRYSGPASESDAPDFHPYDVEGKVVLWKGPLGGLSSGGNSVASTIIDRNDAQEVTFHVVVHTSGGNFTDVSCTRG